MRQVRVQSQREISPGYFLLKLEGRELAEQARPGQFLKIKAWERRDPLLPRPFSLHEVRPPYVWILYQKRGLGTSLLSHLRRGDQPWVEGPLGKPFPLPNEGPIWLVAGGVGVAPFFFYARILKNRGLTPRIFYGARSRKDLLRLEVLKKKGALQVATEDGSFGHRGLVTDLLEQDLHKERPKWIVACGPPGMLSATAKWAESRGLRIYLSLETFMACGQGLCLGCVVKRRNGGYLKVCLEGPAVDSREVDIEALR